MLVSHLLFGLSLALFAQGDSSKDHDDRIKTASTMDTSSTGASTTPDGRVFLILPHVDGTTGPKIVEVVGSKHTLVPYPNVQWNSWNASTDSAADAGTKYVSTNAQRVGPDGNLWVVDSGVPGQFLNSSKLVSFNLTTNEVERIYYLGDVVTKDGLLNDVRFNGKFAYLTEYAIGSIIVLDLETGDARMVLRGDTSTVAVIPDSADGQFLISATTGQPQYIHADQLEVSPDGRYFYYQPGSGYMWRLETKYLNEALYNKTTAGLLPTYTKPFSLTPATGGTAIDAEGNIYYSDTDRHEIRYIAPNRTTTLLVRDSRLEWVDAMWVDSHQRLWMCASQLNRGDLFVQPNNQSNTITKPVYIYTIDIGNNPSPIDHA
jgi:sugar lactone lactonase YvrE